jgi:hypothetical protein
MSILKNDIAKIAFLYILCIVVRYYFPHALGNLFFYALLVVFYKSKNNSFWIAFFFILFNPPGYLFADYSLSNSLPKLSLTGSVSALYYHLVFIVATFKAIRLKRIQINLFYKKGLFYLLIYLIFLMFFSIIYDGKITRIFGIFLMTLPLSSFYFVPKLITSEHQYVNLFKIIFAFSFILFFAQVWDLITKIPIAAYFGETQFGTTSWGTEISEGDISLFLEETTRSSIYGVNLSLISFIGGLYYLTLKKNYFNKNYLIILVATITLSFIMTGTRGWMITLFFILICFVYININKPVIFFKIIVLPLLIIFIAFFTSDMVEHFVISGFERLETVVLIINGDNTADGTLSRINERAPRVMKKFKESPIFGFGFTNTYRDYQDGHVGNHTMLLNAGIIGYILFMYLFIQFNYKLFYAYIITTKKNIYRLPILVFIISFFGMFILHSSSGMMFGYEIGEKALMLALFFSLADLTYKRLLNSELRIKKESNQLDLF